MEAGKIGPTTLITYLRKKYDETIRENGNQSDPPPAKKSSSAYKEWKERQDIRQAAIDAFCAFSQEFLNKYKPVQTNFVNMSIGLVLGDGQHVSICDPPTYSNNSSYTGTSRPDTVVHITMPQQPWHSIEDKNVVHVTGKK